MKPTLADPTIDYEQIIYNNMSDLQSELLALYTGESAQLFSEMLPMCGQCGLLPIGATDCITCHREIVCITCRNEKNIKECASCWKGEDTSYDEKMEPMNNLTVHKLLSKATFRCPYQCGLLHIPYDELENHVLECPERFIECPQGCGAALKVYAVERHVEKFCNLTQV